MVNNSCETVVSGNNTSKLVSKIVKQISHRRISISLHQLLEIVKPEVRQEIINAIANPDISRQHNPCKARKKPIFNTLGTCSANDTASESSSTSESGSEFESSNDDEDFTVDVVKVKKRD